jgi:uncharacterized protein YjiS (DUF1127 family)
MSAYADYMKLASAQSRRATIPLAATSRFAAFAQALKRRGLAARIRNSVRDLERLDDRLLNDVGLRRERFPSGATRVVRF